MPQKCQLWCAGGAPCRKDSSERQPAADAICLFMIVQARRGEMKPVNVRGTVHDLKTRPAPYVNFYPDPRLFLWVQVYYCCSNSFSLVKCLYFHFKKTLLRLSCLDCLLDNWPDHQSKAPSSSALGNVGKHMFISSEWLFWCCTGFIRLAKNHEERACVSAAHSCLLIDISSCIFTPVSSLITSDWFCPNPWLDLGALWVRNAVALFITIGLNK